MDFRVSATEWAGNVTEDVSLDGEIPNVKQVRSIMIDWFFDWLNLRCFIPYRDYFSYLSEFDILIVGWLSVWLIDSLMLYTVSRLFQLSIRVLCLIIGWFMLYWLTSLLYHHIVWFVFFLNWLICAFYEHLFYNYLKCAGVGHSAKTAVNLVASVLLGNSVIMSMGAVSRAVTGAIRESSAAKVIHLHT